MFGRSAISLVLLGAPLASRAQVVERFTLSGERVAVHNIAGKVTVESGTGDAVVVEIKRGGMDAKRLLIQQLTDDGRQSVCIVYPNERIIYRPTEGNPRWTATTSSESECRGGAKGIFSDRRIEVRPRGQGVQAWADVRILVPRGHDVLIWNLVGELTVSAVSSALELDAASATVSTRGTSGSLRVKTGAGNVTVASHAGDLTVEAASGDVTVDSVQSKSVLISAGSGALNGHRLSTDALRLNIASGRTSIAAITARRVRAEGGDGPINLEFESGVDTLSAHTGSGELTLAFPPGLGAEVELESSSGAVTLDFAVSPPHTKRSVLRGTIGDGHGRITAETGSGNIKLLQHASRERTP